MRQPTPARLMFWWWGEAAIAPAHACHAGIALAVELYQQSSSTTSDAAQVLLVLRVRRSPFGYDEAKYQLRSVAPGGSQKFLPRV